MKLLMKSVM